MAEGDSPTVARRRVRLALREAREAAELTQQQVADEMEWSLSKVIRIEGGEVSIAPNDLRPLLTYLGIKDRARINDLLQAAKIARTRQRRFWWQAPEFREHLTDPLRRLIEFEAEMSAIRYYCFYHLPGPLQTPAYAEALMHKWDDELTLEQIRYRVDARQRRRETLDARLDHMQIYILLDESVLWRPIGGNAVMAEQLEQLVDLAASGHVHLRMIPFAVDTPMTNNAAFEVLVLGEDMPENAVLYRENGLTDELVEDVAITSRHRIRYDKVWSAATDEETTVAFVRDRIRALRAAEHSRRGDTNTQ
ncbi:helix-turn-helix domain-containing protein [Krasilnikovia sp. MM14-A1004]|uniref:helix-turn-helix domain-containing protein n=1 Tax=Krasilnikovia sp. MM14-A1004 TaxID=3373541 RepID=UPI00399D0B4B